MRDLNPVPSDQRPIPTSSRRLALCGNPARPTGEIVSNVYTDHPGEWPLYMQYHPPVAIALFCDTPNGMMLALTHQWRPCSESCIELPAGAADPQGGIPLTNVMREVLEEVGEIAPLPGRAWMGIGVAQDVGREILPDGGPKYFYPVVIEVRTPTPPIEFREFSQLGHTQFYRIADVMKMFREGQVFDMVARLFIPAAYYLVTGVNDLWSGAFQWEAIPDETIEQAIASAREAGA